MTFFSVLFSVASVRGVRGNRQSSAANKGGALRDSCVQQPFEVGCSGFVADSTARVMSTVTAASPSVVTGPVWTVGAGQPQVNLPSPDVASEPCTSGSGPAPTTTSCTDCAAGEHHPDGVRCCCCRADLSVFLHDFRAAMSPALT